MLKTITGARVADLDSLLIRSFTPTEVEVCKEHVQAVRVQSSKSAVCPKCISTAQQRESLASNIDHLKTVFTILTHTAILDSDTH